MIGSRDTALVVMTAGLTVALHWVLRDTTVEEASQRLPWWSRAILLAGLIIFVNLYVYGGDRAFIYFQF